MIDARRVEAERLDELAADDPKARASRHDLARINGLMGHARLMAGMLAMRPLRRVLEIGAGDGRFMLRVARRLSPRVDLTLLDQQDLLTAPIASAYDRLGWKADAFQADVFDYLERSDSGPFDAIVANLFLHHFEEARLTELLRLAAAKTETFAACEPERSSAGLLGCRLMPLIGCNEVTRHDARVSVRAGFRARELSTLWPEKGWALQERSMAPFSHTFRAVKR